MFYYQDNRKLSKPGESQNKIVTKARKVTYVNRFKKDNKIIEKVSYGWEIVEEKVVSPKFTKSEILFIKKNKTVTTNFPTTITEIKKEN